MALSGLSATLARPGGCRCDGEADYPYDVFLSHRGAVAAVAQEIADVLKAEGLTVRLQAYDFALGGQSVLDIHAALKTCRHLLIAYSHDYDGQRLDPAGVRQLPRCGGRQQRGPRIGVLRCDDARPDGLLRGITFGTLFGVDDPAVRRQTILKVSLGHAVAAPRPPRVFGGGMPLENRLFTGREDQLTALHATLSGGAVAALTQVGVHGLGCVGKASLARAYIARHDADYPGGIWWVTAADRLIAGRLPLHPLASQRGLGLATSPPEFAPPRYLPKRRVASATPGSARSH